MNTQNYYENDWNFILGSDSYKASHQMLLPSDLVSLEDYGESRGGDYEYITFAGLRPILNLIKGVQITKDKINEAKLLFKRHFGSELIFDAETWEYICDKYDGKLPLKIYAVKEGSVIKSKNVLFKVVPTEEKFADLAGYIETILMRVWYPLTICSNSSLALSAAKYYAELSANNDFNYKFLLHDFGSRGVTCREQAQYGGAMHLLSFLGSDNLDGIRFLMKHYDEENWAKRFTDDFELKRGFSVPATEHLVMTIEGRENEKEVYRRLLKKFSSDELSNIVLSLVSDTYDIYNVIEFLYSDLELRNYIINRKGNTVLRPDSGDAFEVISKMLDMLSERFGYYYNEKGYKVLNNNIKILQGDGIDLNSYLQLLNYFIIKNKWSVENFIFGSGGGLLMKFNRDTTKFAIKCSWAKYSDGREVDVYKDPITSGGSKKSKCGKLWLFRINNEDITIAENEFDKYGVTIDDTLLELVFDCGNLVNTETLETITERIEAEHERVNMLAEIKDVEAHIKYITSLVNIEYNILEKPDISDEEYDSANIRITYYENELKRLNSLK